MALTLSASRNSVATSSSDGKTEKSSGRCTYMLTSRISTPPVMFSDEQQVEHDRRQRHDHHHDDADDGGGNTHLTHPT